MGNNNESSSEEIYGVCMEVAGIESCGFGVGPMEIPTNAKEDKE